MAGVRIQVLFILFTLCSPVGGLIFARSPRPIDAHELEAPPLGSYVELHVDHIQPLNWTIKTNGKPTRRFALAWIGDRALLLETKLELPPAGTLYGEVHRLADEPRTWVDEEPKLRAVLYDTIVELQDPSERMWTGIGCWAVFVAMLGYWFVRWRRWRHPKHARVFAPD